MTVPTFTSALTVTPITSSGSDVDILAAMMVSTQGVHSADVRQLADDPDAVKGKLNFLMKNRHGTPFEHASMTFLVHAPIAVFREWQRHRIGISYNEESGRYKQLEPVFYLPPRERPLIQVGKPGHYHFEPGTDELYGLMSRSIRTSCTVAYQNYEEMLAAGVAREVARGVLPVYIYSSMYVTLNPRSLMNFLSLRTTVAGSRSLPWDSWGAANMPDAVFPSYPMWEIEQCALKQETFFAQQFPITHEVFRANGSVAP